MAWDSALEPLLGGVQTGTWLSWWNSRVAIAAATLILPLILTYTLTSLNANWTSDGRRKGDRHPPPVPYLVPGLGNTFQFAYDTEGFLRRTLRRFGSIPFRLNVGLQDIYYIPHGEPTQAMFKHSRDLSMKPIIVVAMRDQFGMVPTDVAVYERDGSGDMVAPIPGWEHMDPAHRIFYNQHRDLNALLSGPALDGMMARFVANYTARLRATSLVGDEWTILPDLFVFLRGEMFHAICTSLLGERFFDLCPDFARDFWDFDACSLTYLRRTPRWLAPGAYAIRDRVLASLKKWNMHGRKHAPYDDPALADVDYEPVWGARLMRVRAEMFDKAGFSVDGNVSMDLGFVWASSANVIPATLWMLLNILLSENLTERATAEMADCFDEAGNAFDIPSLSSKPLLNGAYLEALRYCSATTSARNPIADDFALLGWSIPRDALMMSIAWFGGHDPDFWNTGRTRPDGKPSHPVDAYWAERFLEYPDDPASGPVRKPDENIYRPDNKKADKSPQDDKTAKVVNTTAALQGHFYPYGGGSRICPGRHLAKQEMLVAVSILMKEFEIEVLNPAAARLARPDPKVFATGAMGPDRRVPVRVRRRR